MEPGLSIQIIWPLAAEEAIAGTSESIEPVHLFNAILKFAELQDEQFERMLRDAVIAPLLVKERDAVKSTLSAHGIDTPKTSTNLRHALRDRYGKGACEHRTGRTIHRSDAAKDLCNRAEDSAQAAGRRRWEAVDLCECLLQTPGTRIAAILAGYGAAPMPACIETPLLDKYGREVTAPADKGGPDQFACAKVDAVCRVVVEYLFGPRRRNALLVETGERTAAQIVVLLAALFGGDAPPKGAAGKRIVELSLPRIAEGATSASEVEARMAGVLREAAESGNVLLWLSAFHLYVTVGEPELGAALSEGLAAGQLLAIASTVQEKYTSHIKPSHVWQRLFQPIWLHTVEVPTRL